MRGSGPGMRPNGVEHDVRIGQDGLVSESEHREPSPGQIGVTPSIRLLAQAMNAAVQFNDQFQVVAAEVRDPRADAGLTAEFEALEPPVAETSPHRRLGKGHSGPEAAWLV